MPPESYFPPCSNQVMALFFFFNFFSCTRLERGNRNHNGKLTVPAGVGELQDQKDEDGYVARERRFGKYSRTLEIPQIIKVLYIMTMRHIDGFYALHAIVSCPHCLDGLRIRKRYHDLQLER